MSHILIVDDEPFVRQMISHFVGEYFACRISAEADVSGGLAVVKAEHVDVVLLDVNLKGEHGSGWFMDQLNELDPAAKPLVIIVSSMSSEDLHETYKEKGVEHFFTKTALVDDEEGAQLVGVIASAIPRKAA